MSRAVHDELVARLRLFDGRSDGIEGCDFVLGRHAGLSLLVDQLPEGLGPALAPMPGRAAGVRA